VRHGSPARPAPVHARSLSVALDEARGRVLVTMRRQRRRARALRGGIVLVVLAVALLGALAHSEPALGCGGGAGPGRQAPGACTQIGWEASAGSTDPYPAVDPAPPGEVPEAAPLSPWPPDDPWMSTGRASFRMYPQGGYYWWAYGQCTWWAQWKRQDENLQGMGDAWEWPWGARDRGYRTGSIPSKNATVTFAPGTQGAGGAGHLAHVEAVYPAGWFLVSEMNFDWNGGGWGRVDYRYAHTGAGVGFIY